MALKPIKATYNFPFAYPIFNDGKKKNVLTEQGGKYSKGGGVYYTECIYYLWYEFLKLNEGYKQTCVKRKNADKRKQVVYEDFGNIHNQTFREFWKSKGEYLFGVETYSHVEVLNNATDYMDFADEDMLTVAIPLSAPKRTLQRELNTLLKKHHKGRKRSEGRVIDKKLLTARYVPNTSKITALNKVLLFKQLSLKHPNETHIGLWDKALQKDIGFSKSKITADNEKNIYSNASRLLRKWELIDNKLEFGKFELQNIN